MAFRAVPFRLAGALALSFAAMGCLPKIGDPCTTSLDCSQRGERLCDPTQPEGYCTVFNCEPDTCPDAAACVAFNETVDPACQTKNDGEWPRFERTFCVIPCGQDSDCREGYACLPATDAEQGRRSVDIATVRDKVCLVDVQASGVDATAVPGVCDKGDPGNLPDPYVPPTSGTGGSGGSGTGGSTSGSGGTSGTGGSASGSGGTSGTGGSGAGAGGSGGV